MVIGSGNSAVEEAAFLTRFSPKVTILARGEKLSASKIASEKALHSSNMEVRFNMEVVEFKGKHNHLDTVIVRDRKTDKTEELHPAGVFVFIGLSPNSASFKDVVACDELGFVLTGLDLQTKTPGIFAAGDVRAGSTKQLVSAAGEGATVWHGIREHLVSHAEV